MKNKNKCLIIDGNNLAHRAYHQYKNMRSSDGKPSGVVFGVPYILWSLIKTHNAGDVIVAFDGHENGIGFNKYFGLPELLIEKEVVTRKKGSSRYYMGDKMIANGEDAFLRKLYEDEELRKKLIRKSGINTISKTRKQLERIVKNLYPVITTDFEKHQDIEDDEE